MHRTFDKEKMRWILLAAGLFILCNLMLLVLARFGVFTDEADNLLGGSLIARGQVLYRDYYSQHPPVMYYLCAVFSWLGCQNAMQYRIALYLVLSAVWALMLLRYGRHFGKVILLLYPMLYIFAIGSVDLSHMVLSDQVEANALVVLFFEFALFIRTRGLKLGNCVAISLAIFFAIGTAATALYPILFILLGVVILEISWYIRDKAYRDGFGRRTLGRYAMLIGIVAAPFVPVLLLLLAQNTLYAAYEQAFLLNVTDYAKYSGVSGGLLANLGNTLINFFKNYIDAAQALVGRGTFVLAEHRSLSLVLNLQRLIYLLTNLGFMALMIKRRQATLGVISLFFAIFCTMRGIVFFHSIPYYAISAVMLAYLLQQFVCSPLLKQGAKRLSSLLKPAYLARAAVLAFVILMAAAPYVYKYKLKMNNAYLGNGQPSRTDSDILTLTEPNDRIYVNTLGLYSYLYTQRLPAASVAAMVPWYVPKYEAITVRQLAESRPKIVIYNPTAVLWVSSYQEFSPGVDRYIRSNYTPLGETGEESQEWIRNDYLDTAKQKLGL